jgi:hypothetical protein
MSEAVLRYPSTMASASGSPFIMFGRHRAVYSDAANNGNSVSSSTNLKGEVSGTAQDGSVKLIEDGKVAMYVPMGVSIGDNMMYDTASTGVFGTAFARGAELLDSSSISEGLDSIGTMYNDFENDMTAGARSYGAGVAAASGAAIASRLGNKGTLLKAVLGGAALGAGANVLTQEASKSWQTAINPREFLLFKAPSMRAFSLSFRFIPDSQKESETVQEIIKWFRMGMYPDITNAGFAYTFPDAFSLQFNNIEGIPALPEMYLESANTTYNPNSMSYYKHGNRPVEILLSLSFKEIQPLHRKLIEAGF